MTTLERDPDHGHVTGTRGPQLLLDAMDDNTAYATSEIKDLVDVDVSQQTIRNWLHQLHDDGHVERRKANEKLILWWLTEDN